MEEGRERLISPTELSIVNIFRLQYNTYLSTWVCPGPSRSRRVQSWGAGKGLALFRAVPLTL